MKSGYMDEVVLLPEDDIRHQEDMRLSDKKTKANPAFFTLGGDEIPA